MKTNKYDSTFQICITQFYLAVILLKKINKYVFIYMIVFRTFMCMYFPLKICTYVWSCFQNLWWKRMLTCNFLPYYLQWRFTCRCFIRTEITTIHGHTYYNVLLLFKLIKLDSSVAIFSMCFLAIHNISRSV